MSTNRGRRTSSSPTEPDSSSSSLSAYSLYCLSDMEQTTASPGPLVYGATKTHAINEKSSPSSPDTWRRRPSSSIYTSDNANVGSHAHLRLPSKEFFLQPVAFSYSNPNLPQRGEKTPPSLEPKCYLPDKGFELLLEPTMSPSSQSQQLHRRRSLTDTIGHDERGNDPKDLYRLSGPVAAHPSITTTVTSSTYEESTVTLAPAIDHTVPISSTKKAKMALGIDSQTRSEVGGRRNHPHKYPKRNSPIPHIGGYGLNSDRKSNTSTRNSSKHYPRTLSSGTSFSSSSSGSQYTIADDDDSDFANISGEDQRKQDEGYIGGDAHFVAKEYHNILRESYRAETQPSSKHSHSRSDNVGATRLVPHPLFWAKEEKDSSASPAIPQKAASMPNSPSSHPRQLQNSAKIPLPPSQALKRLQERTAVPEVSDFTHLVSRRSPASDAAKIESVLRPRNAEQARILNAELQRRRRHERDTARRSRGSEDSHAEGEGPTAKSSHESDAKRGLRIQFSPPFSKTKTKGVEDEERKTAGKEGRGKGRRGRKSKDEKWREELKASIRIVGEVDPASLGLETSGLRASSPATSNARAGEGSAEGAGSSIAGGLI